MEKEPTGESVRKILKKATDWIEKGVRDNAPVPIPTMDEAKIQARYLATVLAASGWKFGKIAATVLNVLSSDKPEQKGLDKDLIDALDAIAQGYGVETVNDRYIIVENPNFKEEVGSDPKLVIDVHALKNLKP